MRTSRAAAMVATLAIGLVGCESMPVGPGVAVLPKSGKPYELFQQEDMQCRSYAAQSLGPNANNSGNAAFAGPAVAGTAIGAAVGAIAGGGRGAAVGAAVGLAGGSAVGASNAQYANYSLQQRYDIVYQQCMYAKGNQLPPQPAPTVYVRDGYYGAPVYYGPSVYYGLHYGYGYGGYRYHYWR